MILTADYHTHTPYSHGKNTVFENVARAKELGLKSVDELSAVDISRFETKYCNTIAKKLLTSRGGFDKMILLYTVRMGYLYHATKNIWRENHEKVSRNSDGCSNARFDDGDHRCCS